MVNIALLHYELASAGLPVVSVNINGIVDYSRPLTLQEQETANTIILNHNPAGKLPWEVAEELANTRATDFKNLPEWATWTPNEAEAAVINRVLTGQTQAELDTWIDTNVTNIATARTALKLIAKGILDVRLILSLIAKMLMYLRDVVINTRR